ncbi:MAG: type II toxin-antitoxin system VapB family antitoxin [Archangium sp.]|nr:type II toxin-antitoxin system VapB family antitoxin [Archangium sp.]
MRTTVNVDPDLLAEVARLLQTRSLTETVNAALREVITITRRARLAERVRKGSLPVPTPEEVRRLRQQQVKTGSLTSK